MDCRAGSQLALERLVEDGGEQCVQLGLVGGLGLVDCGDLLLQSGEVLLLFKRRDGNLDDLQLLDAQRAVAGDGGGRG